jgi:hypothetical protein
VNESIDAAAVERELRAPITDPDTIARVTEIVMAALRRQARDARRGDRATRTS